MLTAYHPMFQSLPRGA